MDGRSAASGDITHYVQLSFSVGPHSEEKFELLVTQLGRCPVILGYSWLRQHRVHLDFDLRVLTFSHESCRSHCSSFPVSVPWKDIDPESCHPEPVPENPQDPACGSTPTPSVTKPKPLEIHMIGSAPFTRVAQKKNHEIFVISMKDIEKALNPKQPTDPSTVLPEEYHKYLDVFSKQLADSLPPHQPYDHHIRLEPGAQPTFEPLYGMSWDELLVLKKYLDDNLTKDFIRASSSPAASPILFVRKPEGGLRFCVDYRGLNAITIKNHYPLPLIRETLDRMAYVKYFTKLDVVAAFNKLRMAKGDEWLTAFRTRYSLYEYLVMPFGLSNAPASFQNYINNILQDYLDAFCTAYIDNILIYSNTLKEHKKHVRQVLQKLREAGLQLNIDKCEFQVQEVKHLGLIISTEILEWTLPRSRPFRPGQHPTMSAISGAS